jgi:hypothetical protein
MTRSCGLAVFLPVLACAMGVLAYAQAPATVTIDAARDVAPVNPLVFGTNLHANDESTDAVKAFIRDTGLTIFRYPDAASYYFLQKPGDGWGSAAGKGADDKLAASYLGDFKNAVSFARETGCAITACVCVENCTVEAAVEWVKYAKAQGLGITHWCLGNEVYYEEPLKNPDNYVACIRKFSRAMKAADPSIKIGMDFGNAYENRAGKWAQPILRAAGQDIDFIDVHWYAGRSNSGAPDWSVITSSPLRIPEDVNAFRRMVRECVPGRNIEICYLEWGIFAKEPGQQSLANALFAADCLGRFLLADVRIACNYNFQEKIFGLIPGWCKAEGWGGNPWNGVTVRPKAMAIKLWTKHMAAGALVDAQVAGGGTFAPTKTWHELVNYTGGETPYLAAYASRDAARKRLTLMVINKKPDGPIAAGIAVRGFRPAAEVKVAVLTGPDYLAHNDDGKTFQSVTPAPPVNVKIVETVAGGAGERFDYTFPAHSVTVIEMTAK